MKENEPTALIVTRRPAKEMADGTLRVQFDVEPNDRKQFLNMFPDNGDPIAVAALDREAVLAHQQGREFAAKPSKGDYGQFAKWLVQSGAFCRPDVWRAIGTDKGFLAYVRTFECDVAGKGFGPCGGDIFAAHVRRIANGAGVGIKPEFSAIPLCDAHHTKQHNKGESVVGGKAFFDARRIHFVSQWAKWRVKQLLQIESLAECQPLQFSELLKDKGVSISIPPVYL